MSAARLAELAAKLAVPLLAVGVLAFVLVEPQAVGGQSPVARGVRLADVPVETSELVCPGPETVGVRGADGPKRAPSPALVAAATAPGELRAPPPGSAPAPVGQLEVRLGAKTTVARGSTAADLSAAVSAGTGRALSLLVVGSAAAAPGIVAEQRSVVPAGDLRGLVSATCLAPQDDIWLVGGGTEVGRRGRLVLTNPHESTTEVSIDVLTSAGPADRLPGSTVALKPRSRTVVLLDALAPGVSAPVLHVRSTGGAVGAVLGDAWLDGTTPRGTDDVIASLPPARRVLVPGVRVDGAASLRLAVPGATEAVAQVRLVGEKGAVELPDGGVVRVGAAASHDVDLGSVPPGAYTVEVTADVPVLAGAMVQRRGADGGVGEIAWSASSDPITSLAGVAGVQSADGWHTDLVLGAPGQDASLDVVTRAADGTTTTTAVQVTGGTTKVVPVTGASAWLRPQPGSGPVVAARFVTRDDALGPMVTTGPLRQVTLTRRPAAVAPDAG